MRRDFRHQLTYEISRPPSVNEVVDSLLAQEKLIQETLELLQLSIPGLHIQKSEISVSGLSINSVNEQFLVAVWAAYQHEIVEEVMDIVEYLTGYNVPDEYDALVTLGVILLALWGAKKIANVVSPSKERGAIENSYNTYMNIFSDKTGISAETIEKILEQKHATAQQKQNFFSAVAKFFRMSKRHGNSAINPQGTPRIGSEVISEVAGDTAVELAKVGDTDVPFQNVTVEIRATDRDQRGSGWYGKIEGITDRVKLKIFPSVDLISLANQEKIKADVLVTYQESPDGSIFPKAIKLTKLIPD